jgi:hypothetical protein
VLDQVIERAAPPERAGSDFGRQAPITIVG